MEPTTLTATVIATLAFKKFLESSATELGKKFTIEAINKMDELRQKIWNKLRENSDAENALKNVEQGITEKLTNVATYLEAAMEKDTKFASQIQIIAQKINAGKIQDKSSTTQNIYNEGTGLIGESKDNSELYMAKEIKIYKNNKDTWLKSSEGERTKLNPPHNILSKLNVAGKAISGFIDDVIEYETTSTYSSSIVEKVIEILDDIPGMTPCRTSLFKHSSFKFSLQDNSQVRTWTNRAVGGDHVFLADPNGKMLYGGFVWAHANELKDAIKFIKAEFT